MQLLLARLRDIRYKLQKLGEVLNGCLRKFLRLGSQMWGQSKVKKKSKCAVVALVEHSGHAWGSVHQTGTEANREVGRTALLRGRIGSASAYCHRKTIGKMNTHAKQRMPAQVPGKESLDGSSLDSESQRTRKMRL